MYFYSFCTKYGSQSMIKRIVLIDGFHALVVDQVDTMTEFARQNYEVSGPGAIVVHAIDKRDLATMLGYFDPDRKTNIKMAYITDERFIRPYDHAISFCYTLIVGSKVVTVIVPTFRPDAIREMLRRGAVREAWMDDPHVSV